MTDLTPTYPPRILAKAAAAAYCGLTEGGFDQWVRTGKLPKAMKGTHRWDKVALDLALDRMSGIDRNAPPPKPSALAAWLSKREEREAAEAAREATTDAESLSPYRQRRHRERLAAQPIKPRA